MNEFEMWSDLYYDDFGSGVWQRIVRPETWEGFWTQDRIDAIRNDGGKTSVVYHAFKANVWSGNCYAPFNYIEWEGYRAYTNFERYTVQPVARGCPEEGFEAPGNNEVRVRHENPWLMQAGKRYYVGARYMDMWRATYGENYPWAEVDFTYDNYYFPSGGGNWNGYINKYRVDKNDRQYRENW